jgi:hypothetical protein
LCLNVTNVSFSKKGRKMLKIFAIAAISLTPNVAFAQYYGQQRPYGSGSNPNSHYVRPHIQRDGDFVGGHYRTNPNQTQSDNYGARGNYNPNNGTFGGQRRNGQW